MGTELIFVILWLLGLSVIVAVVAANYGKNPGLWFLVGLAAPVLALPLLIIVTKIEGAPVTRRASSAAASRPRGMPANTHPCPKCNAPVLRSRDRCPSCGVQLGLSTGISESK